MDTFKVRLISMDVDGVEYHVPFLKEIAHKHESVVNIWMDLSPYLNFLNYEILQHILQKFKDSALQIRMDMYIEKIRKFFKTTRLCDFLKCWPVRGKAPPAGDLRKFLTTKKKRLEHLHT